MKRNKMVEIGIASVLLIVGLISAIYFANKFGSVFISKGTIGDFIGGIANPIIGVLSALLVYFTLNAQIDANRIQIDSLNSEKQVRKENEELNFIEKEINGLFQIIKHLEYTKLNNDRIKGISALYYFTVELLSGNIRTVAMGEVELLLDQINYISFTCNEISKEIVKMETQAKSIAFKRFVMFYNAFLQKSINSIVSAKSKALQNENILKSIQEIDQSFKIMDENIEKAYEQIQ